MSELPSLISDLTLILGVAGIFSILFKYLKQPVVLAYIVAGIVISFFISKESDDYENIKTWADIGIIFLLFGLGLEFSFKKLMKVGTTALIACLFIIISMVCLGYFAGICFGWSHITSLFLGAMLCMSSTMIIIKVFDDLHLTNKNFAGIVLGILIIEDLVAVLMMVLLSTVAVSQKFAGADMLYSIFKLVAFLLFWFLLGTFLIPTFLRTTKRFLNEETLLIVSLSFCLGMVFLATQAGFSSALGAFIMGSIMAETIDSERIEKIIIPIKNFFGAIFFVSVGMMVQVAGLGDYIVPILIISLLVIIGQMIFATTGILLAGQNLKTSVSAGFSMTQIGEFSYIIGALGISLGVIEESLYQIVVAASVITIFVTPYMMKLADPAYNFLEKKIPAKWLNFFEKNNSGARPVNNNNLWNKLLTQMAITVLLYYFLCIIVVFFALNYGAPWMQHILPGLKGNIVSATIILSIIAPFLRAIIIKKDHSIEFIQLWRRNKVNRGPLIFTIVLRVFMCTALIVYVLFELFHTHFILAAGIAIVLMLIFAASKHLRTRSIRLEQRFKDNLNEKEKYEDARSPVTKGFVNQVLERDLHLSEFVIQPHFSIVGKTLKELNFRQFFGINVITIVRGDTRINVPNGEERIYPGDHLVVLGTDKQMEQFQRRLEEKRQKYAERPDKTANEMQIKQVQIEAGSSLIGKTIKTSQIQESYDCMVIGIERNNCSMLNPDIHLELEEGDILWVVGEYKNILKIRDL
ncbi:MAG: cation:proton antiporter [Dysgonamonadaceae bacterium]|jgi:CPA2 family monovalent cation:H+ antiporter-2|nr:cation:proton antiporter [Dysgonamonadaceae bacterium]